MRKRGCQKITTELCCDVKCVIYDSFMVIVEYIIMEKSECEPLAGQLSREGEAQHQKYCQL